MGAIVQKWKPQLILTAKDNEDTGSSVSDVSGMEEDVADLKRILTFTAQLLKWTINKDVYNSTEVRCIVHSLRHINTVVCDQSL